MISQCLLFLCTLVGVVLGSLLVATSSYIIQATWLKLQEIKLKPIIIPAFTVMVVVIYICQVYIPKKIVVVQCDQPKTFACK